MQICSYCNIKKDLHNFSKERRNLSTGIRKICKSCSSVKYKQWASVNKTSIRNNHRKYKMSAKGKAVRNMANTKRRVSTESSLLGKKYARFIKAVYKKCAEYREHGFDFHVDHIIPLKGKLVSGLHVPWNLRIVKASVNLTKGNSILQDMV